VDSLVYLDPIAEIFTDRMAVSVLTRGERDSLVRHNTHVRLDSADLGKNNYVLDNLVQYCRVGDSCGEVDTSEPVYDAFLVHHYSTLTASLLKSSTPPAGLPIAPCHWDGLQQSRPQKAAE